MEQIWQPFITVFNSLKIWRVALVAHKRFLCALKAHFGIQNALLMRIKSADVLPGSSCSAFTRA